VKTLGVLVAIVILLAALQAASSIVVPLLLAVTIAVGFHPISRWLAARGAPPVIASIVTIVAVLAAIGLVGFLIVLAAEDLVASAPNYGAELSKLRDETMSWLERHDMQSIGQQVQEVNVGGRASRLVADSLVMLSGLVGSLFNVLILTAFMQIETQLFERKLELILPAKSVARTQAALGEVQKYLRVKFLLSLMNGVFLGGWCWMMGVSNPLLWGVIAFVFNWVPIIGSLIAGVPPVLLGLIEGGIGTALGVAAGYALVNIVVDNILEARLMGRAMGLSPLVLMVSLLVWGFVLGPVGALLSVPLTVAVRIYLDFHPEMRWIACLLADGTKAYQDLRRP
jgi:AI-2 transport protein TqsA